MILTQICIKCDQFQESSQSKYPDLLPHRMAVKWGLHIGLHTGERVGSEGAGRGSDSKDQREEKGLDPKT